MNLLKKTLFLLVFLTLLISCKRDPPLFVINNLNGNKIFCFGHGGMGIKFEYPIDTYESFEPCLRIGSDGTEMDVQLTKDSVLIAFHNSNLNEGATCDGTINDKLWSEIWGCHIASPISSTVNLISLNNLYDRLNNNSLYTFTFDCKLYTNASNIVEYKNQFANAIINFKNLHHLRDNQLYIESSDTTFLRILKNKNPDLCLFIYPGSFADGLQIAEKMHLYGITTSNRNISTEQIALSHEKGFRIALWNTENDKDNIEAISKSPDFIQSDDIIHLLKVFGKYKN